MNPEWQMNVQARAKIAGGGGGGYGGGAMLPIDAVLPALMEALRLAPNAVLAAAPGAGKTTRAPLALLQAPWAQAGKLILLSPRRITARAAAAHLAAALNEPVGRTVGYRVRMDAKVSAATRLEVVTEGIFTRWIQDDPSLDQVAGVIFDEFHERHLEADLGLALACDAQAALRPDLRLLVMSATLDTQAVAALLGGAPVIAAQGRLFPIAYRYLGYAAHKSLEDNTADAVMRALAEEDGDVLVFLPGARDIDRTARLLQARVQQPAIDVCTLYGAMDGRAQDAALAPSPAGWRKIVLSTAIAESSLTIDGVRVVIDAGFARKPRFEPGLGLTRLETVRASQAAVTQRAGRAGRTQPGVCYRLWDEPQTRAFPAYDSAEILDADLRGLALDLAAWGAQPCDLRWMDPPPAGAYAAARQGLMQMGALDGDGRLSDHGKVVSGFALPPPLAHMMAAAAAIGEAGTAAALAVLLTEQGLGGRSADLSARYDQWRRDDGARAHAARRLAARLAAQIGASDSAVHAAMFGAVLALGFPDRIAKSRGPGGEALMANGRGVVFDREDPLARAQWTVVADASGEAGRARVLAAAALDADSLAAILAREAGTETSVRFDAGAKAMRARRTQKLGAIIVQEAPETAPTGPVLQAAWVGLLAREGLALLPAADALQRLLDRIAFMRGLERDGWPHWTLDTLRQAMSDWGDGVFARAISVNDISPSALTGAVKAHLDPTLQWRLDDEAPETFTTPLGTVLPIDYAGDAGPAIDVRLQEMFGQTRHPAIASGRAPLLVRLLSPAHRPLQATRDLPGFWAGSYAAVRADMRGRYPKHPWPDNPAQAEPTRRTKPKP